MLKWGVALSALAMLGGCATNGLYQWGGYEQKLYTSYKDPNKVEELRETLETLISQQQQDKHKVAPGLYAELGTIYLQKGDTNKAVDLYAKERDTWPESSGLMTAMIKNLERLKKDKEGEAR